MFLSVLVGSALAQPCNNNHLTNADFTLNLTNWTQYGTVPSSTNYPDH